MKFNFKLKQFEIKKLYINNKKSDLKIKNY